MNQQPQDDGHPGARGASDGSNSFLANLTRRRLLGGGLVTGAMLMLAGGCESTQRKVELPPVPNPKAEPVDYKPTTTVVTPAPQPAPTQPMGVPPNVISRSRWTSSRTIASLANPMNGVNRMTVHHTAVASNNVRTEADAIKMLNSVRNSHLQRGWADIGYHFAIDPQGRIWEGRPLSWQGAHVENTNEHNIGVVLMGNFDRQSPTAAQQQSLDSFLADSARRYRIPVNRIYTHRELKPTECPGTSLQRFMVATRGSSGRLKVALA